ncbi:MAG: UDP-glucose 4-epimerase GalE, partial [Propionibacteriaceae bacterium]|nr:UDP-glucose 4-epimerase GalE [Propionibacteriaceae bacterium]
DAFADVTGVAFTPEVAPRRPGDPARIVADGTAAAADIDWKMRYTVRQMVETAWEAWKQAKLG